MVNPSFNPSSSFLLQHDNVPRHVWVYNFLDWSHPTAAVEWYIGLFVFFIIAFYFCFGVHKLRDFVITKVKDRQRESIIR